MLVKDVMNIKVKTIDKNSNVQQAAKIMTEHSIGSLIVVENKKLVGIITERDIMTKVVAGRKDSANVKVKDIMTSKVTVIEPDADIDEAVKTMLEKNIKKLPVVQAGMLIGILTSMDLCAAEPKIIKQISALLLFPRKRKLIAG